MLRKPWTSLLLLMCIQFGCAPNPPKENESYYRTVGVMDHTLHFVERGDPHHPLIMFIHGTPGSSAGFDAFLSDPKLHENYHLIAVDRLGFGRSAGSGPVPSFEVQARSIGALWSRNHNARGAIVVGHSLGGSIAYRVAVDYPDEVGAVLAISAAADPELSAPRWYNHAANWALVKWMVPHNLRVANIEMMPLADELTLTATHLPDLEIPVTIVQGTKDLLVKHPNADFAKATIDHPQTRLVHMPDHGHFIIWEEQPKMVDEILRLAALLEQEHSAAVQQSE